MASEPLVALLPMRGHSERVIGKNLRMLDGVPLYHYIVRTLLKCPEISRIVVDTDSAEITQDIRLNFQEVTVLPRPESLRGDRVPMTEILHYDAAQVPAGLYLQTHSTNPFLTSSTIKRALECWKGERQVHDSLFTVTRLQGRLWDSTARPLNHNPWLLLRTQDLPPLYIENSNFYLFPSELIRSSRRRIGDRPRMFEIDHLEGLDIDDERDFAFAEAVMKSRKSAT